MAPVPFQHEVSPSFASDEERTLDPDNLNNSIFTYIAQWLSDTPIYYDALEIVVEKARRFWWGQQIDLAIVAFSMLLSVEGRRRGILSTSAFLALAHLVNLSFAQNLFYLALILTPSLLPPRYEHLEKHRVPPPISGLVRIRYKFFPPKPKNWHPHILVPLTALALNYGSIFLLPYAADTESFVNVVLFTRFSTFLPLILPEIIPASWGTIQLNPHDTYNSLTSIFQIISAASFTLHIKATLVGLAYNLPSSHHHRHSAFILWDVDEQAAWERGTTPLSKVLGSISDHPVVKAVGGDVLIYTFSLGLWAAVRAADARDMLKLAMPIYDFRRKTEQVFADEISNPSVKTDSEPPEDTMSEHSMTLRRRRRSTRSRIRGIASPRGPSESPVTPGRKRGRPRRTKQNEVETSYEPSLSELSEGDILLANELDWESAALAWGLAAFAGLGSACAGVFGGECTSR
ncbi:hypothetical protein AAE478_002972 [Parahypoxylon ruwenzoriense]